MSRIVTPLKVRQLQRTLYRKAKSEPEWRAWTLYGDLCREDVLREAMQRVKSNDGAAGIDGVTVDDMVGRADAFLEGFRAKLQARTYRPQPVLRVWIPKADGKERPLGIPTVEDRVVQTALVILLEPILEADFHPESYGYRPQRSAHDALESIRQALWEGRHAVLDADLSGYFDSIPHGKLLRLLKRRVSDGAILGLVKAFLAAGVVEGRGAVKRSLPKTGKGTPQGGVLSPLLANLYLTRLDHAVNGQRELHAKMVRYADDFVILTPPQHIETLHERLAAWLEKADLQLNPRKTRRLNFREEGFDFLGFRFNWRQSSGKGSSRHYPHVEPSVRSCTRLRDKVRDELNHWTRWRSTPQAIGRVNRIAGGWANYFHHGNSTRVMGRMQRWLEARLRGWLLQKHRQRSKSRYVCYPQAELYSRYGLCRLPLHAAWNTGRTRQPSGERPPKAGCGRTARPV